MWLGCESKEGRERGGRIELRRMGGRGGGVWVLLVVLETLNMWSGKLAVLVKLEKVCTLLYQGRLRIC